MLDIAESHSECIFFLVQKGNFLIMNFPTLNSQESFQSKEEIPINFKIVAKLLSKCIVLFSTIVHQMQKCCFQEETL